MKKEHRQKFLALMQGALDSVSEACAAITGGMQQKGMPVTCKKGCSACCEVPVKASMTEAIAIAIRYPEIVAEVLPEALRHTQELNARSNMYSFREPCVFLDKQTKACRVYDIRPMECRKFFVLTDPKWCSDGSPYSVAMLDTDDIGFKFDQWVIKNFASFGGWRFSALPMLLEDASKAARNGDSYNSNQDLSITAAFGKRMERSKELLGAAPQAPPEFDFKRFKHILDTTTFYGTGRQQQLREEKQNG